MADKERVGGEVVVRVKGEGSSTCSHQCGVTVDWKWLACDYDRELVLLG